MKNIILILTILIAAFAVAATSAAAQPYEITQSVIAGGGGQNSTGTSAGGNVYRLDGTIGQSVAGQPAAGAQYAVIAGFFTPENFAPTSAGVSVGGRVTSANGSGIRNVRVTLADAGGAARTVSTGAGGYYSFAEVPAGATYLISVFAKRYRFANNSQIRSVTEDIADVNFAAENNSVIPSPEILIDPND